jgi:hypothetical protein
MGQNLRPTCCCPKVWKLLLGREGARELQDALGLGEATERPASPRSPLSFLLDEATVSPASPRTPPPPSVPIVNPQSKTTTKPLQDCSRRRSRKHQRSPCRRGTCLPPYLLTSDEGAPPAGDVVAAMAPPRDLLPLSPLPPQLACCVPARYARPIQVYSRRRTRRRSPGVGLVAGAPSSPASPASQFISRLAKLPGRLLPIPCINKRRRKRILPPSKAPRRSRRLAGLGVLDAEACPGHLKKQVIRALDFDLEEEREQVSQHILEEYAQRFQQPLSPLHIKALAALFGWLPPDDVPGEEPVECLV